MSVATEIPLTLQDHLAGRYVLKREAGRGGAATVYLAHDLKHERLVAIKVLHPELSHALGAQRFMREIKLTASLQHPHILPIHDSGQAEDQLFYVMPFVEGDSLRQRLGADSRLSLEEAVRIGREIAGALAYAHERGVVHRDIKPENILFSGGHAVLADFGIARAIDRASEKITQQGMITGTPAYMSPEQARDRAFDGRSDVYSLACVLYEAIAGVPPFVGDTPQQLLSQRVTKPAPLLREYRHDVPAPIEAVIAKALATSPDDRYDDARAFSAALSAAIGNSGESLTARAVERPLMRNPWLYAAVLAMVVLGVAASSSRVRERLDLLTGRVDSTQYAVLPFQYIGGAAPDAATEPVANGVYDAMRQWEGLPLAGEMAVADAMRGRSSELSVSEVAEIARRTRAGRAVWGRVRLTGDSVVVRVGLYNALSGSSLREVSQVVHARGAAALQQVDFRQLVADLLIPPHPALLASRGDRGTKSFGAWQHYQLGADALEEWNLAQAAREMDSALALDPAFPQANLWLAQVRLWRGEGSKEWMPSYLGADRARARLSAREQTLLDAIGATSRSDFPGACHDYERLRQRDSLDVAAWLGLALCQGNDHVVVATSNSPSGFAFRSSPEQAWRTASRALEIAPASFVVIPFEWLKTVLIIDDSKFRGGPFGAETYGNTPVRVGDSVTYYPVSMRGLARGNTFRVSEPALRFNRDRMLGVIEMLARRLPENPDVFEALATLLETRQEITGTPSGRYSALTALERARTLATDPTQRLRLAIADVRMHLKLGDFARAAASTDSIMHAPRDSVSASDAKQLAGLSSFAGDAGAAARYIRLSTDVDAGPQGAPLPAAGEALSALFARTSLGLCGDSLDVLVQSVERALANNVSADARQELHDRLLERDMLLAAPCSGGRSALRIGSTPVKIIHAQQAVARGDTHTVLAYLDSAATLRTGHAPTEVTADFVVQEAWLAEKGGDPQGAIRRLDLLLASLPSLPTTVLSDAANAAAIGRAMAYRAELAGRTNDPITATLWANRVLTLWAHAGPNMEPTLARMRQLAATRPIR